MAEFEDTIPDLEDTIPDLKVTIPDYVYRPLFTNTQEVKDAAKDPDNYLCTEIDVTGAYANGEPCHVVIKVENNICVINDQEIQQLRSCVLKPLNNANNSKKYGVQISTKIGTDFVWFEIFFDSPAEPLKIVNICRKCLHEKGGEIEYLCHQWTGIIPITVSDLQGTDSKSESETDSKSESETFTVILDEEGIFLFRDISKRIPDHQMSFYKESTDTSIERALVQHNGNRLILESLTKQFVIENATEFPRFTERLRSIKPKPKNVFEDHSELVKYLKELNRVFVRHREERGPRRREIENWDAEIQSGETSYMRAESEAETANKQAIIIARELDDALEKLSVVDEISLPWIIAEDEIRQMIENPVGLADSDRDVLSGGLDPNSPDHLMRSFSEIKELLTQQRYDMALSRLRGTKIIFKETTITEIKSLMAVDDLELLKKLYYHSFF